MRSYRFTELVATEQEFPQLLKLTAPKHFLVFEFFNCINNIDFNKCFIALKKKKPKRAEEFRKVCDTDLYHP